MARKTKGMEPEGIWHQFEVEGDEDQSLELAAVILTLNRRTGVVSVDTTMSNPLEAWAIVATAQTQMNDALDAVQEL